MIIKKNSFILDHIAEKPVSSGLIIRKKYENKETVDIAYIYWAEEEDNCYIRTVGENFQNNVVLYDDFKDFIYLIDEAYRLVSLTNGKKEITGFENEDINF